MQIKKEEMRARICDAALKKFAEKGFSGTKVSAIAKEAGVSVGNIYRYYMNKEDLFYTLITPAFVKKCKSLIAQKIEMAHGHTLQDAEKDKEIAAFNADYIRFLVHYRRQIVIVMECSHGTQYEHERQEMIELMLRLVADYLQSAQIEISERRRAILPTIYRNLLQGTLDILKMPVTDEDEIGGMLQELLRYHFLGLSRFLKDR
jgi:AcrR family transcriptional regulator